MTTLVILTSQLADLFTFALLMQRFPISMESNPVMRVFYTELGMPGVIGLKLLGTLCLVTIVSLIREPLQTPVVLALVSIGLVGALINTIAGTL